MDIFEAMETCRAIRRLKPDPVPDELLQKLVHYATRAPNAGNRQIWGFLVVTDPAEKKFVGDVLRKFWEPRRPEPEAGDTRELRQARNFRNLALNFEKTPAIIFTCISNTYPNAENPHPWTRWSTVYPATQNLLLAARALGLGAAMTTFHTAGEDEIKEHFGIPENVFIGATIPVGYPEGRYGPVNRRPAEEVTHWNRWGAMQSA